MVCAVHSSSSFAPPTGAAGWYPDPAGSGSMRYWDGSRWTDALSSAVPPAGPHASRDDARGWALAAHLSALLTATVALAFVGPLVVYLAKRDDPFVRRHAAQALNFNLSLLLYGVVLALVALIVLLGGLPVVVGVGAVALLVVPLALAWFIMVCVAAAKAGQGADFRYPLTIRFVR